MKAQEKNRLRWVQEEWVIADIKDTLDLISKQTRSGLSTIKTIK